MTCWVLALGVLLDVCLAKQMLILTCLVAKMLGVRMDETKRLQLSYDIPTYYHEVCSVIIHNQMTSRMRSGRSGIHTGELIKHDGGVRNS